MGCINHQKLVVYYYYTHINPIGSSKKMDLLKEKIKQLTQTSCRSHLAAVGTPHLHSDLRTDDAQRKDQCDWDDTRGD